MRRRGSAAHQLIGLVFTGLSALVLAACGGGKPAVFHPAGSLSPASGTSLPASGATQGGFHFPAGVSIDFVSPLPASVSRRAIVTGYEQYIRSLWSAVITHGADHRYLRDSGGNALAFVRRQVRYYTAHDHTVRGTIRYFGTTVTTVYFGNGANVTSCVDASRFTDVTARTGTVAGPVFPARYARYLEDVAEGRRADGTWFVSHSSTYPASTSEGAMCR